MIILKWAQLPEADVVSYKVYRSIIGFKAPIVPLAGKTLQLKLNRGPTQIFTFGSGDIVDTINATIVDGRAYKNQAATDFFVRSNIRQSPGSVEIIGGSALADLSLTVRLIVEKSEDSLIATVPAPVDPEATVEYEDLDGCIEDWYALTIIDSHSQESEKTNYRQPILSAGPICVIEGTIVNLQGTRIADAEVIANIQIPPTVSADTIVTKDPIRTQTGPDGRFSLPILQGALIKLEVPEIGFSMFATVPAKAFVFIQDLKTDEDYKSPTGYTG